MLSRVKRRHFWDAHQGMAIGDDDDDNGDDIGNDDYHD